MKSYHDQRGNLISGASILEDILANKRKTRKLIKVLTHFEMQIAPNAKIGNKKVDWIVPISW